MKIIAENIIDLFNLDFRSLLRKLILATSSKYKYKDYPIYNLHLLKAEINFIPFPVSEPKVSACVKLKISLTLNE